MNVYAPCIFWTVALIASVLRGKYATEIFFQKNDHDNCKKSAPCKWHQRWLNFVGSFVGWIALWALVQKYYDCASQVCSVSPTMWHIFAALVAFVGITGYLPMTIITPLASLGNSIDKLVQLAINWLTNKVD